MSFFETPVFPDYLAYGLLVGPEFSTDVVRTYSGAEDTNQRWEYDLVSLDGSTTYRTPAERQEIDSFFRVMKGRANGFRAKNWSDFEAVVGEGVLSVLGSPANTYQLMKRYTSGAYSYDKPIYKPIEGKVTVQGGGVYSIDYTTGLLTHISGNAPTGWYGEFHTPVRFDHDVLRWEVAASAGGRMYRTDQLKLVEIRIEV